MAMYSVLIKAGVLISVVAIILAIVARGAAKNNDSKEVADYP